MGDEKVKNEAMEIMAMFQVLPRLVVFDLDYTLWPFYCECRSKREMPSLYPHAKGILYALKEKGVDVAIASRSPTADIAKSFLDKLDIRSMFVAQKNRVAKEAMESKCLQMPEDKIALFSETIILMAEKFLGEIFSSWTHKTEHFQRINRRTGVPYNSMLFFDDEDRNIDAVSKMGVTSILVENGVNLGAFRQGLLEFSRSAGSSSKNKRK